MAVNNPYSNYKQNAINTATPQELVLMLYDGCIKFINRAIIGIEDKNVEMANNNIIKAQNIVFELMISLDMDYEISKELELQYDFMHRTLIDANIKKDKRLLEEVKELMTDLRDTWKEAMKKANMGG